MIVVVGVALRLLLEGDMVQVILFLFFLVIHLYCHFSGDFVFSVGCENGAIARVYSISSTEQSGYWKGIGEEGFFNCTVVETPTPLGVACSFNGKDIRLFDINTCKPTGKVSCC